MSTSKSFFCFFTLFFLVGCGPKETDSTNAKEDQDRARLRATLSQFEGNYRGTVIPSTGAKRAIPVELSLSVVDVADGTNDNREVIFRPELQGTFTRVDYLSITPVANRPVKLGYKRESGEVSMSNTDTIASPTPNQGRVNMNGTMTSGTIDGRIEFTIGDPVKGQLHLERY